MSRKQKLKQISSHQIIFRFIIIAFLLLSCSYLYIYVRPSTVFPFYYYCLLTPILPPNCISLSSSESESSRVWVSSNSSWRISAPVRRSDLWVAKSGPQPRKTSQGHKHRSLARRRRDISTKPWTGHQVEIVFFFSPKEMWSRSTPKFQNRPSEGDCTVRIYMYTCICRASVYYVFPFNIIAFSLLSCSCIYIW
jgi:hypothetical protein